MSVGVEASALVVSAFVAPGFAASPPAEAGVTGWPALFVKCGLSGSVTVEADSIPEVRAG